MTDEPKYVRIGYLVKHLGLSAETWRRYAAARKVRCVRASGPGGNRVFDLESCKQFLAGERPVIDELPRTARQRNAAFRARRGA